MPTLTWSSTVGTLLNPMTSPNNHFKESTSRMRSADSNSGGLEQRIKSGSHRSSELSVQLASSWLPNSFQRHVTDATYTLEFIEQSMEVLHICLNNRWST